jgi:hypothetical protein
MKQFLTICLILASLAFCCAQNACETVTLSEVFNSLSTIESASENQDLNFRKFSKFNFSSFLPEGDVPTSVDFYNVGYDAKNILREVQYQSPDPLFCYRLGVFYFKNFKIIQIRKVIAEQVFYHVAVIVMLNNGENYLINLKEQFVDEVGIQRTTRFFKGSLDRMSAVMVLDRDFFPVDMVKFIKRQIVQYSFFVYNKEKKLKYETVGFFLNTDKTKHMEINEETCISSFKKSPGQPQQTLFLQPEYKFNLKYPLWLYNAAHGYDSCD